MLRGFIRPRPRDRPQRPPLLPHLRRARTHAMCAMIEIKPGGQQHARARGEQLRPDRVHSNHMSMNALHARERDSGRAHIEII